MRKFGIFLCCLSIGILAVIIGMAGVVQQIDMLKGSFSISLFAYVNWSQWACVIIIFCVGLFFSVKEDN